MQNHSYERTQTYAPRVAAAFAGVLFLAAIGAGPAQAHDALQSTSPERDSTVTTAPEKVTLALSQPPTGSESLNLNVITVTDSTGTILSDGQVTVSGASISTNVTPGTNGPYKVLWRTVSSDGHPIEGNFTFTVEDPAVTSTAAVPPASAPAPAGQSVTPTSTESAQANTVPDRVPPPDDSNALLAAGAGALVLAIIGVLVYLARRKERTGNGKA